MAKKGGENSVSLDSFLDILTCLQGVLMLIIITTGIDAAQTKVMVATPIELAGDELPIYIECRNNQLFYIPIADAREAVNRKEAELIRKRKETDDISEVLGQIGSSDLDIGDYIVDFSSYLSGKISLHPKVDEKGDPLKQGYVIENQEVENEDTWFGKIIANMDIEEERIIFKVRDDSYKIFRDARFYAWTKKAKVTYELLAMNDPLTF